jgi:pyridoxal phosphate enzyme (YggS family)
VSSAPEPVAGRLAAVRARIDAAARAAGRDPSSVTLVAVSKTQPAEAIRAAYAAGQRDFGENYAQELVAKHAALADLDGLRWHFIGALQRNKAKDVAPRAHVIEAVDRLELARELDKRAAAAGRTLEVLLEVNVGGEASKSGAAPADVPALVDAVRALPRLALRGLMTIPPEVDDPADARPYFAALRALAQEHGLAELSMGMSHDFEAAIAEGATLVRVGTAIFGARSYPAR